MRKAKKSANLLQMSPILRETVQLVPSRGNITLEVSRSGWMERISIRYFKQPAVIRVELDSLGRTVLQHCDGSHTVGQIADMLASRFGKDAEPVLPRLVKFLQIVEMNGWIGWKQ